MKTPFLLTVAITAAVLAGCAAPAAFAPQGVSAAGSPLFEAMQEPGSAVLYKQVN